MCFIERLRQRGLMMEDTWRTCIRKLQISSMPVFITSLPSLNRVGVKTWGSIHTSYIRWLSQCRMSRHLSCTVTSLYLDPWNEATPVFRPLTVQIHRWNEAASLIRTPCQVPRVARLEGVHCIIATFYLPHRMDESGIAIQENLAYGPVTPKIPQVGG